MDSKSISRKGVGVQVPASAPAPCDPLARALLPVLLHRVANTTQLLSGLDALLAADPAALEPRAGDLSEAGERIDEAGWLLALLSSALGARLLLERRERRGLPPLVAVVRDCLRREQRDLAREEHPLPDLSPAVGEGWQLPWAIGSMLYLCGRALPPRAALAWSLSVRSDGARLECRAAPGQNHDIDRFAAWLARELPRARFVPARDAAALELPEGWLVDPEPPP